VQSPARLLTTGPPPAFRPKWTRYAFSGTGLGIAVVASYIAWANFLKPQVFTPLVQSTATIAPSAPPSANPETPPQPDGEPKWADVLAEGQRLLAAGDGAAATKKFKEAQDQGAGVLARVFIDEARIASSANGPCKVAAFSHPRLGIPGSIGRPSIANGAKGAVVTWTDDHEQAGHDHAYSVVIDNTGRPLSRPRDLTPEANEVMRPALLEVGERTLLLYGDRAGREAGVRVRWLDAEGRIAGASVLVGAGKPGKAGNYWPAIDRAPDGFYVAWQDDRNKEGNDLYLRHLNSELQPMAPEIRATDYGAPKNKTQPQVRTPSVAVASNAVYTTYKLEHDNQHLIMLMRTPLTLSSLNTGLDDTVRMAPDGGRADRELGDVEVVNEDKVNADAPAIACGTEGCFLAWHGEQGGAYAALIEPVQGRVLWRKKFAPAGGHPSLGVSADGQVEVAYFEKGLVRVASLTRDGIGTASTIAHISNEQPRPWIANGATKGEWFVAWQDYEAGHTEAYAARVACR
jgi:serine/threonine-protein kinase